MLDSRAALHFFKQELEEDPIQDTESIRMCRDSICILTRLLLRDIVTDELERDYDAAMA